MASFLAESIRAVAVGGLLLTGGSVGYYAIARNQNQNQNQKPKIAFINDKEVVGVKLFDVKDKDVRKITHNTACLENMENYQKITALDKEVFFKKQTDGSDFETDCAKCKCYSKIEYYSDHVEFLAWTP